ncbi:MAG: NAD(P)-dependent oxidoreductase [Planctomycetota bacterium]
MKVLIAGGAGYVGSPMARHLWEAGHDVTVFDKMAFGAESLVSLLGQERFTLIKGDIRDAEAVNQAVAGHDAVVLLAAIVGEPACNRDPDLARDTNLGGARNLLNAAQAAGVSRFAFASTCSNYGVADTSAPVTETAPLNPISVYSETKVTAEEEILAANAPGFTTTVLRLSTAFGISPRMRFDLLVSDFTWAAVRDHKIEIYGEQFWRPFVHVNDIAKAFGMVLTADPEAVGGDVFNVGANHNNTQKSELGQSVKNHYPEAEIAYVKRDQDPRSYRVDFAKINDRLGYQPDWTIDDGIAELRVAFEAGVWPDPDDARYRN